MINPKVSLHGPLEDAVSNAISTSFAKAIYGGDPTSKDAQNRAEFYALTLSKTGEKFFATPSGKGLLTKVSWVVALPAFTLGAVVGYIVFKRRSAK